MIYRKGVMSDTYSHTSRSSQFRSMNLRSHPVFTSSFQYAVCFFRCEEAAVAKDINEICQSFFCHIWNHIVDDIVNVFGLSTCKSASYGVGTEEGADYFYRHFFLDSPDDMKHLYFICCVQAISAFYLYCSCSFPDNLFDTVTGLLV